MKFKYDIGQCIKDDKRDLVIVSREIRVMNLKNGKVRNKKWYEYKCNKCPNKDWNTEENLTSGQGCNTCRTSPTKVTPWNCIWATDRWMCDLGVSEEDAKTHTYGSGKEVKVTCPHCGRSFYKKLNNISINRSINCKCGDKTPYPEKFTMSVLNQLGVEFETQLTNKKFDWVSDKRYDFYIPSLNMIIETHGIQHYEENSNFKMTLAEQKENDRIKKELALSNGIDKYIVIDCRYSRGEYIKKNIICSELNELFDLGKIDWLKCEEFALSNLVYAVCLAWSNKEEYETTSHIRNKFKIGSTTMHRYLKRGVELGWCKYDAKAEKSKVSRKNCERFRKGVEIFKEGVSLGRFDSTTQLERQSEELFGTKLHRNFINDVCRGKKPWYKGYTFSYT